MVAQGAGGPDLYKILMLEPSNWWRLVDLYDIPPKLQIGVDSEVYARLTYELDVRTIQLVVETSRFV